MNQTVLASVVASIAAVLLVQSLQPHGAEAANHASIEASLLPEHDRDNGLLIPDVTWPAPRPPFDPTPITPVETTGAF
jgi:hypothetical protein